MEKPTGFWCKGTAVIEDAAVKVVNVAHWYNPFDHYYPAGGTGPDGSFSTYLEFASVDYEDEEAIKRFVAKYGPLGLYNRNGESFRRTQAARSGHVGQSALVDPDGSFNRLYELEDLQEFQDAVRRMFLTLALWRACTEGNADLMRELLYFETYSVVLRVRLKEDTSQNVSSYIQHFDHMGTLRKNVESLFSHFDQMGLPRKDLERELSGIIVQHFDHMGTLRKNAESWLSGLINRELASHVSPSIAISEGRATRTWKVDDLLSAMYLMLALDMTGPYAARQCANDRCRRLFIPTREDKECCSASCSSKRRVYRSRQKQREVKASPSNQ